MDPNQGHSSKSLARELGLFAVFSVSIGAMIGSGVFVLPGLASKVAGPGVILAYFIAGLVVLPAALSQSEMATAMPQAGGTYLFVDRAMGPMLGTIAGFGTWFALVFKAAFALVGLGAYIEFFWSAVPVRPLALAFGVGLITLNLIGAKQSSRFQVFIVTGVLGVLAFFVGDGITHVDDMLYQPFLPEGIGGLLEATGIVFVSYAGVTKVASVAEEVRHPSRNLPLGILISIGVMIFLYPAIVFVVVGLTPSAELASSTTPIATAAGSFMGQFGADVIAVTAVLALLSMANAGLLSSSRYPFAMARNHLAPKGLAHVGRRSGTPTVSIAFTGGAMLILVALVPLLELAKLASTFNLLVFAMVNLSLIAFRESKVSWYRPRFRSPGYPWVQIAGILAPGVLLTQMGLAPLIGALAIIVGGWVWYRVFGEGRESRESASIDALRLRATTRLVADTKEALAKPGKGRTLIPVASDIPASQLRALLKVAGGMVQSGRRIRVVRFEEVPLAIGLADAPTKTATELEFEQGVGDIAADLGVSVDVDVVVAHDRRSGLINYVADEGIQLVLARLPEGNRPGRLFGGELRWMRDLACDTAFLRDHAIDGLNTIAVMGAGGPHDALKVEIADRLAQEEIRFVHVLEEKSPDVQIAGIQEYHGQLGEVISTPSTSHVERADDVVEALGRVGADVDLVILGASLHHLPFLTDLANRISDRIDSSVLLVEAYGSSTATSFLGRILERIIY
ncbi:MAG: amino acid permease [Acidimicrobiia bacterium]|nr:amino acid permease [Acidimicrobiia bacterium]